MQIRQLQEAFIQERKYLKNVTPATVQWYRSSFKAFEPELSKVDSEPDLRLLVKQGIQRLSEQGQKSVSINGYLRCINAWVKWMGEENLFGSPFRLPLLKVPKKTLSVLAPAQVSILLTHKPQHRTEERVLVIALLILDTGLRIDELLNLRPADVDFDNLLIKVCKGKGQKERIVPYSVALRKRLFRYWSHHGSPQSPYFFCTSNGTMLTQRNGLRDLKDLGRRLGFPHIKFHLLRHTFATHYLKSGGSIALLRKVLGHSSITTTQIYEHLQTEDLSQVHHRHSILMSR